MIVFYILLIISVLTNTLRPRIFYCETHSFRQQEIQHFAEDSIDLRRDIRGIVVVEASCEGLGQFQDARAEPVAQGAGILLVQYGHGDFVPASVFDSVIFKREFDDEVLVIVVADGDACPYFQIVIRTDNELFQ